jgi:hypothetical protein
MNNDIETAERKLDEITEFLTHNINQGYISNNTTVYEVLMLIENIKETYLPLMKSIEDEINKIKG